MPSRPPKPCAHVGCGKTTHTRYCDAHAGQKRVESRQADSLRGNSAARGYGRKWRKAAKAWLDKRPLCAECERKQRITAANCVDHVTPHRGDMALFWDSGNWQSLCASCHSIKTAAEDGGFGHRRVVG